MKKIFLSLLFIPFTLSAKTLVIGDSLAYSLAESVKKIMPVDGYYLENSGLSDNSPLNWSEYIKTIPVNNYDSVIISLGANDAISDKNIDEYQQKSLGFIKEISNLNDSALVTWVLPPVMKNQTTENGLVNVRIAINNACNASGITCLKVGDVIGDSYSDTLNGAQIRSSDGIHYTAKGADLIVNDLLGMKSKINKAF